MNGALKVRIQPFEAVHYTQPARLVPNVLLEFELRRALNRYEFIVQQHTSSAKNDSQYFNNTQQIRRSFSEGAATLAQQPRSDSGSFFSGLSPWADANNCLPELEICTAYTVERAATELRSITGKLTFIPPLTLTIITQYPELHFEYVSEEAEPVSASA